MSILKISRMGVQKLAGITVIAFLIVSLSIALVSAQYNAGVSVGVIIPSSGVFSADVAGMGASLEIKGTPSATGAVNVVRYSGNPQPTADVPSGIALTRFLVVTFNMDADDFEEAKITISYTDADVQGIESPYAVYKYIPETDSFIELPSVSDTAARTFMVTVTSIEDPLFAIGGASSAVPIPTSLWIAIVVTVIIIVILVLVVIRRLRLKQEAHTF